MGAVGTAAERYLRLLAEAELRRDGLGDRLRAAAEALSLAGAIDEETAGAVVDGFTTALGLRGRPPASRQLIRPFPLPQPRRPSPPLRPAATAAPFTLAFNTVHLAIKAL